MKNLNFIFNSNLIQSKLMDYRSSERLSLHHEKFTNAAVVILIIPHKNKPYDLVLIKRTTRENDKHSGEMAFPGGKFDQKLDSDYLDTALRELKEELGIPNSGVQIIGCIDDHITPKGYIITPFVAYTTKNQKIVKQETEVHEILKIPINFFADKQHYSEKIFHVRGNLIGLGTYEYISPENKTKYKIFGATAHCIVNYIERVHLTKLTTPGSRRATIDDIKDNIAR
ncbi:hypothetical protein LCGC14_0815120 [marine sediment metagenome]|uniref:Nudix hydrolase domain-containing protein n=1 Tax=marine sediment metagenome TaxID=412755 RepID=A0A0F9PQ57_9ZZZZ|nr:CoA pyrophosphatase [bacterium]